MTKVVVKFGGTSMASAQTISQVKHIIDLDENRQFIVVSAPGKIEKKDSKVTDLLYKCAEEVSNTKECPTFQLVANKFKSIVCDLKLSLDIDLILNETKKQIIVRNSADYTASRGEYLAAIILADYLNYEFVDANELIKFDNKGDLLADDTNTIASRILANKSRVVIPGFYGEMPNGQIKTFSRGGSDITGAIIARAICADIYENWTDVNGFMVTDPNIVKNPEQIYCLSYKELRELSYMGASVLHAESIFPVSASAIPINIRNTFNPTNQGTMIVPNMASISFDGKAITGIAGKKGFTIIHIEKDLMNNEKGFSRKALSILEKHNISLEHMPSGIDTMSLVIDAKNVSKTELSQIVHELETELAPDMIEIIDNISLIATVGRNMLKTYNTASRLFASLNRENIIIQMIDQGSSGLNIIVGVKDLDFDRSITTIYNEFVN